MNWTNIGLEEENISIQGNEKTNIQRYFQEVGEIYNKNDNDYNIEFTNTNREKLIEMNLKCVIKIAKRYIGNGVSLEDLISAGNEGLCKAYDKYNPDRSKFRADLIKEIDRMDGDVPMLWIQDRIAPACTYGKPLIKYKKSFTGDNAKNYYNKEWLKKWVERNINTASFNSVAMMWVTAFIRQEITNNSRIIRKPLAEIKKEQSGESQKEKILDINKSISDDGSTTFGDILYVPDETEIDLDIDDRYDYLHDLFQKLFVGVKLRDRRIVMKRFGIGYIRPMQPHEIAETEQISVARISQIINIAIDKMKSNAEQLGLDKTEVYRMFEKNSF